MFAIDRHTLNDLAIYPGDSNSKSIYDLFDLTGSVRSRVILKKMFENPFCKEEDIVDRIGLLKYLEQNGGGFNIKTFDLDFIEHYLNARIVSPRYSFILGIIETVKRTFYINNDYYIIERSCSLIIILLTELLSYFDSFPSGDTLPHRLEVLRNEVLETLQNTQLSMAFTYTDKKIRGSSIKKLDYIFRLACNAELRKLLSVIYELEVYFVIIAVRKQRKFEYPLITNSKQHIEIDSLFHPLVDDPVGNSIRLDQSKNMCIITGVNMSGKSTFLKAFGICCYLAHLGFPVPAKSMSISPFGGLCTMININDNLSLGYSYFYSEVKRIKYISEQLNKNQKLIIICDELFRGTNPQDAHEGTVAIIRAFSKIKGAVFLLSSHITEAIYDVKNIKKIHLLAFRHEVIDEQPNFKYKIEEGISIDRYGMQIIKSERVIELLESVVSNDQAQKD